jgi:hypothetical protein
VSQLAQGVFGVVLGALAVAVVAHCELASSPASAEPSPSPAARGDRASPPWPEDVASYTLDVTLDVDTHELEGRGHVTWKNTSVAPQSVLWVHLYLNAFKNDRSATLRQAVSGFRGSARPSTFGWTRVTRFSVREWDAEVWPERPVTPGDEDDETDIRVPLPRDVAPGESITIDVEWEALLPSVLLRTGFADRFHMAGQWFPKIARLEPDGRWAHFPFTRFSEFYADYGAYDVTIDAPEGFMVGATGKLVDAHTADGRTRHHYVQPHVHDFAFTAWDEFREKTRTAGGVALRCLYPEGYDEVADIELDAAEDGLVELGKRYGEYPYETLTLVHPPGSAAEAGGMEYPTLITTGGPWYAHLFGLRTAAHVTIHELGHQWFYGMLASNENAYPFLDEGLNSYADSSVLEALHPARSILDGFGLTVSAPGVYRATSAEYVANAPVAQSAADFTTGRDYGRLVYGRTAVLLHTLRRVYGPALDRALARYADEWRFRHPAPRDLLEIVGAEVGAEAEEALRVGLFERGTIDFEVESASSSEPEAPQGVFGDPRSPDATPALADGPRYRGSAILRRRGTMVLPVDVDLVSEDGRVERRSWDGRDRTYEIHYTGDSPLRAVVLDPELKLLADDDLFDNTWVAEPPVLAPRVLERVAYFAAVAMLAGAP